MATTIPEPATGAPYGRPPDEDTHYAISRAFMPVLGMVDALRKQPKAPMGEAFAMLTEQARAEIRGVVEHNCHVDPVDHEFADALLVAMGPLALIGSAWYTLEPEGSTYDPGKNPWTKQPEAMNALVTLARVARERWPVCDEWWIDPDPKRKEAAP